MIHFKAVCVLPPFTCIGFSSNFFGFQPWPQRKQLTSKSLEVPTSAGNPVPQVRKVCWTATPAGDGFLAATI